MVGHCQFCFAYLKGIWLKVEKMHFENSTEACCHSNSQICVFAIFTYFGAEIGENHPERERHYVNLQYGI